MHLKDIAVWSLVAVGGLGVVLASTITPSPSVTYVRSIDVKEQTNSIAILKTDATTFDEETILTTADVSVVESAQTKTIQAKEQTIPSDRLTDPRYAEGFGGARAPIRLTIPKIGVDAAVVYVGIASDGSMDTPKGPADVAWFNLGPHPGNEGSAVISGHYGWKDNIPAVFDDLHTLQKGDKLYVKDEQGVATTFVVRETLVYDEHQDATDIFVSRDGTAHLNLITCGGIWDKDRKSYSERTIVFTDKEQ